MNDLEVAVDLRATAAYLRDKGWVQGTLGEGGGARCLLGAIVSVTGNDVVGLHRAGRLSDAIGLPPDHEQWEGFVEDLLDFDSLVTWNDEVDRTVEDVLDRLESTALALEVRALSRTTEKLAAERLELVPA